MSATETGNSSLILGQVKLKARNIKLVFATSLFSISDLKKEVASVTLHNAHEKRIRKQRVNAHLHFFKLSVGLGLESMLGLGLRLELR